MYMVGGLEHEFFFHILGINIPTDFDIFSEGLNHQPDIVISNKCIYIYTYNVKLPLTGM